MRVCSETPFDTSGPGTVSSAVAIDHDIARFAGRIIQDQGVKWQFLLAIMNSGLGSFADCRQVTLSKPAKFDGSYDPGARFNEVTPNVVGHPSLRSTSYANTSTKTSETITAGPVAASSYSMKASGIPTKTTTWNSVVAHTSAPLIHAGAAEATSLLAHDDEA